MTSIWKQELQIKERTTLKNNMNVNTVVIGAGISGILTAYFLKKKGVNVVIVEAKSIASGQTQNTTAKITSQHDFFYHNMIKRIGLKKAEIYARANEQAIKLYEKIIEKEKINCHFEKRPAYLYSTDNDMIHKLKKEADAAKKLGINAKFIEGKDVKELPFSIQGAVCFENQAQFNPLEFINHLAKQLEIYENTKVLSVDKHMIITDKGKISAENIIFATHYPIINVPGLYFLRQHQERSYVLALKNVKELSGMYYSIDENGVSLRSFGNVLLLGGGGHRTGKTKCKSKNCKNKEIGYTFLRSIAKTYYMNSEEVATWSAQDCMPHDLIPFIGKYSVIRPYWYVATGYKKWGMTSSMIAASIISDQVTGKSNWQENIFTPQRLLIRASFKNLMIDIWESIIGLIKGFVGGKNCRCPHMGCKLTWNSEENHLECSCHGSRFSREGKLMDNPAQIDLRKDDFISTN